MCERNLALQQDLPPSPTVQDERQSTTSFQGIEAFFQMPTRSLPWLTTIAEDGDIDLSPDDCNELDSVERFIIKSCHCQKGPENKPCCFLFSRDTYVSHRSQCLELKREELDMVILANIDARWSEDLKHDSRFKVPFYFQGKQICKTTFLFLYSISSHRYENLYKHYVSNGLTTRQHGNSRRLPANTLSQDAVEDVVAFIKNFARAHALPLPGCLPGHKDKVLVLPSDLSKSSIFERYKEACTKAEMSPVGRSKFYDTWHSLLPHISIATPSSDLCFVCQQNNLAIQQSACLSEEEKTERLQIANDHLKRAKTEREYYNQQVDEAVQEIKKSTTPTVAHYSFDFAQQVFYPYDAQQTGPEYFKAARKCGVFGVCNDGKNIQIFYLIDEAENPGKGADCVISILHHFFSTHGMKEKHVKLHADNCVAQNKNNPTIQYLMWRVMTARHASVELSFMLVGHTKFSPDRFFGIFKKTYRHSTISTINELQMVVQRSSSQQTIPQLIRDIYGCPQVSFYQWSTFLSNFFTTIPNISTYHSFRVCDSKPGVVFLKEFSDSPEVEHRILKKGITFDAITDAEPQRTRIPGLDLNRQWYLYEHIRQHCKSTLAKDFTCPKPTEPKPVRFNSVPVVSGKDSDETPATRKQPRLCSHCKEPGHTKRTCSMLKN